MPPGHVPRDGRFGDLDPEHQQFAVYPRRSPQWVFLVHPSDEIADLAVDSGAATKPAGFLAPIRPKAAPMPPDHSLGLDHSDSIQNRGEESVQPDEEQPIDVPEPHPRRKLAAQDDHLLTQDNVFGLEARP